MSPDNIDTITLNLYDFLTQELGYDLGEDDDYNALHNWMLDAFDKFCTKDRNYN